MKRITGWLAAHPILVFVALVYPLSWYQWLLGLADEPGDSGLNPLGPLAAALVAGLLTKGVRGLVDPFRQIATIRGGPLPWAAAVFLPVVICVSAVLITAASGAGLPTSAQLATWPGAVESFLVILAFIALGEEPGWRGFLLERLQQRLSPVKAVLIVSVVWAVWHAPLLRTEITPPMVAPFLLALLGGSFALAWLYNGSRGGLLPPMLMHATINAVGSSYLFTFYEGEAKLRLWWIYAVIWAGVGLAFAMLASGRLGRQPAGEGAAA